MIIWWSLFCNLISLQVEFSILISIDITQAYKNELWSYALNSLACFFFTTAIILQTFEWDLLGAMITFQAKYRVSELNVVRDTFNREERRKWRWTGYIVGINVSYHLVKSIVPLSTLISCIYTGVDD